MKLYDVLDRLIDRSSFTEAERHDLHAVVADHHADDINGLSDEEKAARPAPINRLEATAPSIFAGGLSQTQLDDIISRAIAKHDADKAAKADTAKPAEVTPEPETADTVQ